MRRWRRNKATVAAFFAALVAAPVWLAGAAGARSDDVDPRLCRSLDVAHRPAPDVEYTPGVDVRGRAVAPADLPGSAGADAVRLERFDIPVTLDFARRMGFPGGRGAAGLPGGTEIGRLTVDGGRASFNGKPLDGASRAALAEACRGYR